MEISFRMFSGYFVTPIPNPPLCDVPLHVSAGVCLAPTSVSQCEVHSGTSTSKNETFSPNLCLRQQSSRFDVLTHETTSTRISLLSP